MRTYQPLAVIHFAAFAYVEESVTNPIKYYLNNVSGTINLVRSMQLHGVKFIVFSSSCATYGSQSIIPIPENAPQNPTNPYGTTKLIAEKLLQNIDLAFGIRSVLLRYFNAAGADPDAELGEVHSPETHLIPLILNVSLKLRSHIDIFGSDYNTPDGTCIRDYVHVSDLAEAHILALNWLLDGKESTQINLGCGHGFSVHEIIDTAQKITKQKINVKIQPRRTGDAEILIADTRKAIRELGWRPSRSDIELQIEDAWRWHKVYYGE
jgi:UDP-glucose-4-epimerase GalE